MSRRFSTILLVGFGVVLLASAALNVVQLSGAAGPYVWIAIAVKVIIGAIALWSGLKLRTAKAQDRA